MYIQRYSRILLTSIKQILKVNYLVTAKVVFRMYLIIE